MDKGLLFYILLLFWLFFGLWSQWPTPGQPAAGYRPMGGTVLLFVLILILGWHNFGPPIK